MNSQDAFKFAATHEWADLEDDGLIWVGVSNHAQEALGDVMFFKLPNWDYKLSRAKQLPLLNR